MLTMQHKAMNTILIIFRDCRMTQIFAYHQTTKNKFHKLRFVSNRSKLVKAGLHLVQLKILAIYTRDPSKKPRNPQVDNPCDNLQTSSSLPLQTCWTFTFIRSVVSIPISIKNACSQRHMVTTGATNTGKFSVTGVPFSWVAPKVRRFVMLMLKVCCLIPLSWILVMSFMSQMFILVVVVSKAMATVSTLTVGQGINTHNIFPTTASARQLRALPLQFVIAFFTINHYTQYQSCVQSRLKVES